MESKFHRVSLFLPCLADAFYPRWGQAAQKILQAAGVEVFYPPDQTCCGQWAVNTGNLKAARRLAQHFLRVFYQASAVVSLSGSCVSTVRHHYPQLFAAESRWQSRAAAVAGKIYEISEFLVSVLGHSDFNAYYPTKATLHDSCHTLRSLGIKQPPRELLAKVQGLELLEMDDPETCCGFGGAFMAQVPTLSRSMAGDKVDQALATGADLLVFTEPGCLLNVDSVIRARGLSLQAKHLVEVLAEGINATPN